MEHLKLKVQNINHKAASVEIQKMHMRHAFIKFITCQNNRWQSTCILVDWCITSYKTWMSPNPIL